MGQLLSEPVTEQDSGKIITDLYECGFTGMQGWRKSMEDAHLVLPNIKINGKDAALFGVFDGHGGYQVAKFCELKLFEILQKRPELKEGNYSEALINTFLDLDVALDSDEGVNILKGMKPTTDQIYLNFLEGHEKPADDIGSTCVVCLIIDGVLYCANSGDSRSILCNNNVVIPLSIDHKPDLPTEIERITKAGGIISRGRVNNNLNLTRTIGDQIYKKNKDLPQKDQIISAYPDITKHIIDGKEQYLVLACDGIWDCLTNQQIIDKISKYDKEGKSIQEICENITSECLATAPYSGPGWDNMTLVIVKFKH